MLHDLVHAPVQSHGVEDTGSGSISIPNTGTCSQARGESLPVDSTPLLAGIGSAPQALDESLLAAGSQLQP